MNRFAALLLPISLAACSGDGSKAEQTADQLEKAAGQSDPTSAAVLENAAAEVRATGDTSALSDPDSPTQKALENAAAINPTGVGSNVATTAGPTPAPPPKQALPNYDGQRLNRDEKGNLQPRPTIIPPNARD
ncbi:MAG TPA: hypothetical protein VEZ48_00665 [Sphingomonadaceae bacterium]|nr:hypothetical protein [Sphingomonadaceae bacterium]